MKNLFFIENMEVEEFKELVLNLQEKGVRFNLLTPDNQLIKVSGVADKDPFAVIGTLYTVQNGKKVRKVVKVEIFDDKIIYS